MSSSQIQILAELQRAGIEYKYASDHDVAICCPFHEDTSPSCHIDVGSGQFICRATACGEKGDFIALLARIVGVTRKVILADLSTRYNLSNEPTVAPQLIETYHARVWKAGVLLKALAERGVLEAQIRHHRIGEHQGRLTIPVKNAQGDYVNIRSYLPGAPGAEKMKNLKGRGKPRIYPIEQLSFQRQIITGGEMKAIVTAAGLNKHGYGATCITAAEGVWDPKFNRDYAGKEVWVMMDIDEHGVAAAELICKHLARVASKLYLVTLPLDKAKYPKGDVNDFIGREHGDLLPVIQGAPIWKPNSIGKLDTIEEAIPVSIAEATNAKVAGKRIVVSGVVSTLDIAPYAIPRKLTVSCTRDQPFCAICPITFTDQNDEHEISPESQAILEMVGQRKAAQQEAIMNELEIPALCRVCKFNVVEHWNVEDCRLSPQVLITDQTTDRNMVPAVCIGPTGLELNEPYVFEGKMHPSPLTQQATLVISNYKPTQDALNQYRVEDTSKLEVFQPNDWSETSIDEKVQHIWADFEANVTKIFCRWQIHAITDLTYHSPLFIEMEAGKLVKGWVESVIVGDSAQGKSETVMNLQSHYGLGEKLDCKNATVAGLLGGLQQLGSRWFVNWGIIPNNDRRLVILEELKGTSAEVIGKLTDMRSSGIAEIPKIERRKTRARTRLLALSNPRSSIPLARYAYGVQAIKELIGSQEDVRRFDCGLVVAAGEIDAGTINNYQLNPPIVAHTYTSALCRELILWAWTRRSALFTTDATKAVMQLATDISEKFSDTIPLVDKGSMRYKIARLAAALAARTFSTGDTTEQLLVRPGHVKWVYDFLVATYSSSAFGYAAFTHAEKLSNTLSAPQEVIDALKATPYAKDLVDNLMATNFIEHRDITDWCGGSSHEVINSLISLLVRKKAISRQRGAYTKTPAFIDLLRKLSVELETLATQSSPMEEF